VGTSWFKEVKQFKSPLHVVAAFLLRSRQTQLAKGRQLGQQRAELQLQVEQQQRQLRQQQQEIETLRQRAVEAEQQLEQAKQSVNLPEDPPLGTHGYGARMISLAVNLARSVGFRGAVRALRLFFQWLGLDRAIPSRTSIRNWLQRLGIAQKARFMNLAATLRWLTMILWLLRTPDDKARAGISEERMQQKLGWVAQYAREIAVWQECQDVVSASLTFINEQGLFRGAADELRSLVGHELAHATSRELSRRLIDFVAQSESLLREGERLPLSTEILESSFGLYKQLERQHSKSGFTSLLACLPALLKPTTPAGVQSAFAGTSAKDVTAWTQQHFHSTVTSRRQAAYAEHKSTIKRATAESATL